MNRHRLSLTEKTEGENVVPIHLLNTKHHVISVCFFCFLSIFHQAGMCISEGKAAGRVLEARVVS